jgi:hypothetical protein
MPLPSYPLINGRRYSFASIEININGEAILGCKELQYTEALEPGEVRGAGPQVLGRTLGDYSVEGSVTVYREEWDAILEKLGAGYMAKVFDVVATYAEEGAPTKTDKLAGCRIKNVEQSNSQGTDALEVKLDLHVFYLLRDNVAAIPNLRK